MAMTGLEGCQDDPVVVIPVPGSDQAPSIKIINFVPGAQGDVDKDNVSSDSTVYTSDPTKLMISAIATNLVGGVKSLSMKFICNTGNVCQSAQTSSTPDSNNKVTTVLRILGGNGSGGAGGQPFLFTIESGVWLNLDATATNFNGMTSTVHVLYRLKPTLPTIASFDVSPKFGNNGLVSVGQPATLTWNASCSDNCHFGIQGHDAFNNLVLNAPNQYSIGKLIVNPSVDTRYTLTATNSVGSVSKDMSVVLSGGGTQPTGMWFYFKMMCAACTTTPCFTEAVWAPDSGTAAGIVSNQNGGYSATQIDASQFSTACP
jgi:hypothetical protein